MSHRAAAAPVAPGCRRRQVASARNGRWRRGAGSCSRARPVRMQAASARPCPVSQDFVGTLGENQLGPIGPPLRDATTDSGNRTARGGASVHGDTTTPDRDGGRNAAHGLQYQYLVTAEALLDCVALPDAHAVRVEGDPSSPLADIVDFEVVDNEGHRQLAAQVKSRVRLRSLSASAAFDVLSRLVDQGDAASYLLQCSAVPGAGAAELARALSARLGPDALRDRLGDLLAASPARRGQLEALERTGRFDRLLRAQLVFDTRSDAQIRVQLRERLRRYRAAARAGLGENSAGVLAGYLVSEVMRRAADGGNALFSMDELRSLLLVDGEVLAGVGAVRDWAVIVGSIPPFPDVARTEQNAEIGMVLSHPAPDRVRRLALTGLSGVGKSALAAGYIADNAVMYDYILWVDAQSDTTLAAGFRAIAAALPGGIAREELGHTAQEVRELVLMQLGRLAGRWLIVFDSADDPRVVSRWIPVHGHGDVVLTSVDSTARFKGCEHLAVPTLTPAEAEQLTADRLQVSDRERSRLAPKLRKLAEQLQFWPLALELATGYMAACGLSADDVQVFLSRLKVRALADQDSVPDGYPRTLAAALGLALSALARAAHDGSGQAALALRMLLCSCYLAQSRIPVYLLAAACEIDALTEDVPARGMLLPWGAESDVLEGVRLLRRHSLVSWDEELPSVWQAELAGQEQTVAVNAVVQEMLRLRVDGAQHTAENLANTAAHVERWLSAAVEATHHPRALILLTHAEVLAVHLRRLGVRGGQTALFFGNTAAACRQIGRAEDAVDLLHTELDLLADHPDQELFLQAQAHLALARVRLQIGDTEPPAEIIAGFERALGYAQRLAPHAPGNVAHLCSNAVALLRRHANALGALPAASALLSTFLDLHTRLDPTAASNTVIRLDELDHLLGTADPSEAADIERQCRAALSDNVLDAAVRLQTRRLIVEALIHQQQWGRARAELAEAHREALQAALPVRQVAMLAHNIGLACALRWMVGRDRQAVALLDDVMRWPQTAQARDQMEPHWVHRITLIGALHKASGGAVAAALHDLSTLGVGELCEVAAERRVWHETLDAATVLLTVLASARTEGGVPLAGEQVRDAPGTLAWRDAQFTLYRNADLRFLQIALEAPPDSLLHLLLPTLAYTLGIGVRRVASVDLSYTLCAAFAHLGIPARPTLATVTVHDARTGRLTMYGDEPRWQQDGVFTGHCVTVLDDPPRLIDLTAEQLPGLLATHGGPIIARGAAFTLTGAPVQVGPQGIWAPLWRDPFTVLYTFEPDEMCAPVLRDSPYVRDNEQLYRQAGRTLVTAAQSVVRHTRTDLADLATANPSAAQIFRPLEGPCAEH